MADQCHGYKNDGLRCMNKCKAGQETCGIHHKSDADLYKSKRNLRNRIMYIYGTVDFNSRTHNLVVLHVLHNLTLDELETLLGQVEALVRVDYPGYTGAFAPATSLAFRAFRIRTQWELAIDRVPHNLRVRPDQIRILDYWYQFIRSCIHILGDENVTLEYVCNPDNADTIQEIFVAHWAEIPLERKRTYHSCFRNMGILGQEHIRRMAAHLPMPQEGAVAAFLGDNQNVHRAETVKYITDIFNKLVATQVPPEQNTLAEVIMHCKLPPQAIILLTQHYCEPVSIYEIPNAYPRALDAVWAYIKGHAEKEELYRRVRDELTDNIGMCAQGNLSRLCNILSGYIDGIAPPVPKGELIQQKLAHIAGDAEGDKVGRARTVLTELGVAAEEMAPWLEAFDDF